MNLIGGNEIALNHIPVRFLLQKLALDHIYSKKKMCQNCIIHLLLLFKNTKQKMKKERF